MAKKNQTLKEISQIVVFLLVVGILTFAFVIYPLGQTKTIMGRENIDEYNPDSVLVNDPAAFLEAGLAVDTFRVEADGLTTLACVYLKPQLQAAEGAEVSCRGTVILVHSEGADRNSMVPLAQAFLAEGCQVVAYDQRAAGLSTGLYRGDGQYEAEDLVQLISHMEIHEWLTPPVTVIGARLGAETGLLAAAMEPRINAVAAITPYLSTTRMIDAYRAQYDTYWLPFFRTLFWWWYNTRSSYAAEYRETDAVAGVSCRTLILADDSALTTPEFQLIRERSDEGRLVVEPAPDEIPALQNRLVSFALPGPELGEPKPLFKE
jgi:pimeloyl-ACP methyl ester carboxylesterase